MSLKGEIEKRALAPHEIDPITAALTVYLHLESKTELVGDEQEGFIVLPREIDWRTLTV